MENCKKCGKQFEPQKGLINYCSLECRNSRTWSEEDKEKKSISAKNSSKVKNCNYDKPKDFWLKIAETRKKNHKSKILELEYNLLSFDSLRYRILYEQNEKCKRCGLNEWLGEKLILELEHKDGNHHNNLRENLEMLCPNCHSLTETWRGRNKTDKRHKISDKNLLQILVSNDWNMRKSLIDVGLSPKGGNYKRCHSLKREYFNSLSS